VYVFAIGAASLSRIAYVNGRYLPRRDATVNIEDRGYQFADGVYELCEVRDGRFIDERRHIERLRRSLAELQIAFPLTPAALAVVMRETIRRNRVRNGIVYLQITRGVARRDHAFPPAGTAPSIVVTARSLDPSVNERLAAEGIAVVRCYAGVRVGIEGEDGLPKSLPLVESRDFFGTVVLAPRRGPARLLGQNSDDELLRLLKEYFR